MEALVYKGLNAFEITRTDDPEPRAGHVLIRTQACGVCHTDIDILNGRYGASAFPLIPGHEYSGIVEAVGQDVTALSVGDRVVIDPNISCGTCRACQRGLHNLCEHLKAYGVTTHGGFADYSVVQAANVHPVGDMPFDVAALAEPVGCVLNGVNTAGTQGVRVALVFGAGPIGALLALTLRSRGVEDVAVVDLRESRLALVESLGLRPVAADSPDLAQLQQATDLAVDATGVARVAEQLIGYAANGGTALFFGVCPPDVKIAVSPFEVFRRQIKIVGAHSLNHNIPEALEVLRGAGEQMRRVISHHVPLSDVGNFLGKVGGEDTMKVQFTAS
jgi:threonine dehydrogenase-like Zn-dependent dehydrogenase